MQGLNSIPSNAELEKAYLDLRVRIVPAAREAKLLALYAQWTRFDPRLSEILIFYVTQYWKDISPVKLNEEIHHQPWPAALGVALEMARELTVSDPLFDRWKACALAGVQAASNEQFFIGLRAIGGRQMQLDARFSLKPYRRWGYLGREILLNKAMSRGRLQKTLIPIELRRAAIKELMKERNRISVKDYKAYLGGMISDRQAERDLREAVFLRPIGRTRSRIYIKN